MIFAGETEVLGENLPSATLSTTNPTWIDPGANPGLRDERPATNRFSHGTAQLNVYSILKFASKFFDAVRNPFSNAYRDKEVPNKTQQTDTNTFGGCFSSRK
jgi:hypothetical protein